MPHRGNREPSAEEIQRRNCIDPTPHARTAESPGSHTILWNTYLRITDLLIAGRAEIKIHHPNVLPLDREDEARKSCRLALPYPQILRLLRP